MDSWVIFWKWAYLIGLVSFAVLVVVVIPLGARDLVRLFQHLQGQDDQPQATKDEDIETTGPTRPSDRN